MTLKVNSSTKEKLNIMLSISHTVLKFYGVVVHAFVNIYHHLISVRQYNVTYG